MLNHRQVAIREGNLHVVENGPDEGPAVLFLHGWPESWLAFEKLLNLAGKHAHAIAVDLPGIGGSTMPDASGSKRAIADCIHELVQVMGLKRLTLVGHDAGGMVGFAYLSRHGADLE